MSTPLSLSLKSTSPLLEGLRPWMKRYVCSCSRRWFRRLSLAAAADCRAEAPPISWAVRREVWCCGVRDDSPGDVDTAGFLRMELKRLMKPLLAVVGDGVATGSEGMPESV
jgi:hypothetical protein